MIYESHIFPLRSFGEYEDGGVASTIQSRDYKYVTDIVCKVYDARGNGNGEISPTLTGDHQNRVTDYTAVCVQPRPRKYILRRLTPNECVKLQGFPDWWLDGLGLSDTAKYKLMGNSLAIPCAYDVMNRIAGALQSESDRE